MLGWYRALVRHPPPTAGRIAVPTLILWGRRDTALGPRFATESLALCDQGRIRWFDGASHWLQHEEPESVNRELLGHLRGGP
jgi:pimeloyl-ACP methyl ester carboxylesterase